MSLVPVALQLYSVRDFAEKDLEGTLAKVKEMGYDYVELAGFYNNTAQEFKDALDSTGLKAVSAHVPYAALLADTDKVISDYALVGCEYIAIPFLEEDRRPGAAGFDAVIEFIPEIGRKCIDKGMKLLYHNHDFEFVKMSDGSYGLDYLYSSISPDVLETEIDTCWVNIAGENPVEYIKKYSGRCPIVHLKDFYKESAPNQKFEFRPVGYGMQVMPEIIEAGILSGAKYFVVEQDFSVGRTSLEAAKMSRDYIRPLGL